MLMNNIRRAEEFDGEGIMIDPIFIGLLATAFAFLYPQLQRIVENAVEDFKDEKAMKMTFTVVWETMVERGFQEKEDYAELRAEMMRIGGRLIRIPARPLILYLFSLPVLGP